MAGLSSFLGLTGRVKVVKGKKAKYTVMIPQVAQGIAEHAQQRCIDGPVRIDHCYLDRDKWAHWPGGGPEPHDLLVIHADDTPEMDSHVKQLAREVGRHAGLQAVFAVKEGQKGPMSWVIDNPDLKRQTAWRMSHEVWICEHCGQPNPIDERECELCSQLRPHPLTSADVVEVEDLPDAPPLGHPQDWS